MIKIAPVGSAEAISQHTPQHLHDHDHRHAHDPAAVTTFSASLLSQHALQLDPDGQAGDDATPAQLAHALAQLLTLLEERLVDMRERALMAGGQPSHGLFNELVQISDVVARLCHLWRRLWLSMPEACEAARGRIHAMFGTVHFLLRVLQHSAEPADWHAQSVQWVQYEALFTV